MPATQPATSSDAPSGTAPGAPFRHLLSPVDVGPFRLPNRIMLTTHNPKMSEDRYLAYLEERVSHGVGMVGIPVLHEAISSLTFVPPAPGASWADPDGSPDPETAAGAAWFEQALQPQLRARAEVAHRHGARCFGQLASRGSVRLPDTFQPMVSPSGIADQQVRMIPHELTEAEVRREVALFAESAARIKRAGLDGAEIHAAHGYLVEQFLSPRTNRRTDRYGGDVHGRMRFLLEIIEEIKSVCGDEFPIGLRISGYQANEGGLSTEEVRQVVKAAQAGLVYVNVTAGTIGALGGGVAVPYVASSYYPPGFNLDVARRIREIAAVPVALTGRMNDPELMERLLAAGDADLIGAARAFIADPEFLAKAAAGRPERIRRCIGVNECHFPDRVSSCPVNPRAGREHELAVTAAPARKRVLVIGGGPAGLEAARTASARGHDVLLVEKAAALGGKVAVLARDEARKEMATLIDGLVAELARHGTEVRCGVTADAAFVAAHAPDAVVVATGAEPCLPDVPGLDEVPSLTALGVLADGALETVGQRVLVVGGLNDHLAPLAAADYLAARGRRVVLASANLVIGQGLEWSILHLMTKRLLDRGVTLAPLTELTAAGRRPALRNTFTKAAADHGEFDALVFAGEQRPVDLPWLGPEAAPEVYRIGDCLAPRRMVHATLDGARVGTLI